MIAAIVLTAIEEALSRATMVQRDKYWRRRSRKGDYTPKELDIQHAVWTLQIGNSMIIEVCAILIHALCVVLFLPHRFVFNLGYGELEETGLAMFAVVLSTTLELVGELLSDHMALRAEMNHDVPADTYFLHLAGGKILYQFGALMFATGVALWTFSRIPTAVFCDSPDPCSCLDRANNNFEMYRSACACVAEAANSSSDAVCANMTLAASVRFSTNPAGSMDSDALLQMGFAFAGFITAAVVVLAVITIVHRQRRATKVLALERNKVVAKETLIKKKSKEIESNKRELAKMRLSLAMAEKMVTEAMMNEEGMLKPFAIPYEDLAFGRKLGEGSFGTVFKALLREVIPVAIKTLRVTKITAEVLDKFKAELKVRIRIACPGLRRTDHCACDGRSWLL